MIARHLAALFVTAAASAHASEVRLELEGCAAIDGKEVRRIVRVESRDRDVDARLVCDGAHVLVTRDTARREIDLSTTAASARARTLALAIIEMGEGAAEPTPRVEPAVEPAPTAPEQDSRAPVAQPAKPSTPAPQPKSTQSPSPRVTQRRDPAPRARRDRFQRIRLIAFGAGTEFFSGVGLLGGAGLRVGGDHPYHLAWWIDVSEAHRRTTTSSGDIDTDIVETSLLAGAHQTWSRVAIRAGVGVAGGAVRMGGHGDAGVTGSAFWAGWVGPHGSASLSVTPIKHLALEASADVGWNAVPVRALVDGNVAASVRGVWLGFQVGVGAYF